MTHSLSGSTVEVGLNQEQVAALGSAAPVKQQQLSRQWLHVVSHLDPKYGGVSAVVPQLNAAIASTERYSVQLSAFCHPDENFYPVASKGMQVRHLPLARKAWCQDQASSHEFLSAVEASRGVHIHGLWQRSTSLGATLARKLRKPYVVSAHGMLEPWALANKRWKKSLYLSLIEKTNLRKAACLHALTKSEASDYRRVGLQNPIAIIPNGVHLPKSVAKEIFLSRYPELKAKRLVLFLGRIHFKKGLDILCRAWSKLALNSADAHLVLAGPDFEGTQANVESLLSDLGVTRGVTLTGMLMGEMKWSALAAADFFVLPSYSEGLSVSVLEAMGSGKPVLISENCNLPEVKSCDAGLVIKANEADLSCGLTALLTSSSTRLQELGSNGEHLVRSRFSWEVIGRQMADLYGWLEGGPIPTSFEIDRGDIVR